MKEYDGTLENIKGYEEICGKYEIIPPSISCLELEKIPRSPPLYTSRFWDLEQF